MERKIVNQILERSETDEIILLTGARQTGKTTAIKQVADHLKQDGKLTFYFTLEDPDFLRTLNGHPDNIWQIIPKPQSGKITILIDEIQYLEHPGNFLKYHFDQNRSFLKLIATGSSGFYLDKHFDDSLAGRKRLFTLPTLSLSEFMMFKGYSDLSSELAKINPLKPNFGNIPLIYRKQIFALADEYMVYGGYPAVVLASTTSDKQEILFDLFSSYLKRDFQESGIEDSTAIYHLLKLLAYQTGSELNRTRLSGEIGVTRYIMDKMLDTLQKTFHISVIKPFFLGHPKELRKMPKLYFMDQGMRNTILKNYSYPSDRDDLGRLYENFVYRFLSDANPRADIQYWRTPSGNEVDFVLDNKYAFEVKWNAKHINPKQYELFRNTYPDIDLQYISRLSNGDNLLL